MQQHEVIAQEHLVAAHVADSRLEAVAERVRLDLAQHGHADLSCENSANPFQHGLTSIGVQGGLRVRVCNTTLALAGKLYVREKCARQPCQNIAFIAKQNII